MNFSKQRHACVLWQVLLGAGVGLAGCSRDSHDEGPQVRRLSPGWGLTTEAVSGVIEGEHFVPVPTQHLGVGEPVTLDSHFEVELGEHRLEDVTWVDEHTLAIRVPAGLAPGWYPVAVRTPLGERVEHPRAYYASARPLASLRVQPRSGPARLWVGEEGRLSLTVENPGGTRALGVQARLHAREPGAVTLGAQPEPRDIEPGERALFTWTLGASTAGTARYTLTLEGQEEQTGQALSVALPEEALQVDARARPLSTLTLDPLILSEGQSVFLTVHVTNPGTERLRDVRTQPPLVTGGRVEWAAASEPARLELGPGETQALRWRGVTRSAGSLSLKVLVGGSEESTGDVVPLTESPSAPLTVFTRGKLVTQFDIPSVDTRVGGRLQVNILVNNTGQSPLRNVHLEQGQLTASHAKTCKVVLLSLSPDSVSALPGGGRTLFMADLRALAPGECAFEVRTQGTDIVDNRPVTSELATSAPVAISP